MVEYNLTKKQKQLLTAITQAVKNGQIKEPLVAFDGLNGAFIHGIEEQFDDNLLGDLDVLCKEDFLEYRLISGGRKVYTIRQKAYDTIENNFLTKRVDNSVRTGEVKDFFISYTRADRGWAEWIAWTLEEAGFSVVIQAWDFKPGGNFVLEMTKAANNTRKIIAVISEDYLNAAFTQSELAAAFVNDPLGKDGKLIPVRVKECNIESILSPIVYLDMVGLSENQARETLLEAVAVKRIKPYIAPVFPVNVKHDIRDNEPEFPQRIDKISLFISYSHCDKELLNDLIAHISLLKRQNIINDWCDQEIMPGDEWEDKIKQYLNSSQIILLLISADFLASDYCYSKEMTRALERHEAGEARVIPIIIRSCDWQSAPFGKLQALPRDAKPVTSWANYDEAFTNIAQGIRLACLDFSGVLRSKIIENFSEPAIQTFPSIIYNSIDVFKYPGVPEVTFVEPERFYLLKNSLRQPGLGVIIEGPSGIGKTTALRKATDQLKVSGYLSDLEIISARRHEDVRRINHIEQWHHGVLAIDDFHRLDEGVRTYVADYLKDLADRESPAKLVIVGIPGTEKRLIEVAFDLGTRIRSFKLGKVSDEIVLSMIEKGERALNIGFDRKSEIVLAAGGSLNIAQILCSNIVAQSGIEKTQSVFKLVHCDLENAVSEVMDQLIPKFGDVIRCFASLDGNADITCIGILQELAQADNGFLSLIRLRDKRFDLAAGIDKFISENYISRLKNKFPDYEKYIYYDDKAFTLIIDDPQLMFYLLKTPASLLARDVGKC